MNRRLGVGMVGIVPGRVTGDIPPATKARDEMEALLPDTFLEGAPFTDISLILRYGDRADLEPTYQRIRSGTLPISVELEMSRMRKAKPDELYRVFRHAILEAVIAVAEKYGLPRQDLYDARGAQPASVVDPGSTQLSASALANDAPQPSGALACTNQMPAADEDAADEPEPTDITIEYQIQGFGTPEDLQKRHAVEDLLDQALQQAGAGEVTGGEIGSGSMRVFCESDDPDHAVRIIKQVLADASLDTGATVQVGE